MTELIVVKHQDFQREILPHIDVLHNYALRLTKNTEDANDLLQETLLKAYRFWDKYKPGTNIRAWLFRIMQNSYINIYRKKIKQPSLVDYDAMKNFYDMTRPESINNDSLVKQIFKKSLDDEITLALESLPDVYRTVVILCVIEGLDYEHVAGLINCPVGTVRSRLHRGRKLLKLALSEYAKRNNYMPEDVYIAAN